MGWTHQASLLFRPPEYNINCLFCIPRRFRIKRVTCHRSVVPSGFSGFLHQKADFIIIIISPPWYGPGCCWGVKPQYTKPSDKEPLFFLRMWKFPQAATHIIYHWMAGMTIGARPRCNVEPQWNPSGTLVEPQWNPSGTPVEPQWNPSWGSSTIVIDNQVGIIYYRRPTLKEFWTAIFAQADSIDYCVVISF